MADLGVLVRLHDLDCETIGFAHIPPPVEIGDVVVTEHGEYRVVDVVLSPPGVLIGALVKVRPVRLRMSAR